MNIYLAARYSRHEKLRRYRADLEARGHIVTSRWINGGHEWVNDGRPSDDQAREADRVRYAQEDWDDLCAAAVVISFTEEPRKTNGRGGRHVEFGAALAMGKRCAVIGWRENVFHCLPKVWFYADWAEFLRSLP